jgi:hypothetical protein
LAASGGGFGGVAAGIQKDEVNALLGFHLRQDNTDVDRIEGKIARPLESCVDGYEIVLASDLQPMSGIEKDGHIGSIEFAAKRADYIIHTPAIEILTLDHVEAELAQGS